MLANRPAIRYRAGQQGPEDGLSAVLAVVMSEVGHGGRSRCALKITIPGQNKSGDTMNRIVLFLLCVGTILISQTKTSFAISSASQAALDSMNKLIAETQPIHDRCKQALDSKNKLKAGLSPSSLLDDGTKLSAGVVKIAVASKGLDKADWEDPQVKEALAKFRAMRVMLIHVGYAAPKVFLSASGQSRADSMQSLFKTIEKYKEESKQEHQRGRALHDVDNYLGRAKRDYNAMSRDDRASPNGQALANELRLVQAFLKESRDEDKNRATTAKEAKAVCKSFKKQVVTGPNRSHMEGMILLSQGRKPNRSYSSLNKAAIAGWIKRIEEQKALITSLKGLCSPEQLKVLEHCYSSHGKPRIEGLYAKTDPVVWCSMAEKGPSLMVKEFELFMKRDDEARTQRTSPEELERKEGWFADDRAVQWKTFFFVTQEDKKKAMSEYGEILSALGSGSVVADPFASREKSLTELRKTVERLAPKWKLPPKGKGHYGTGIATKTVKRWYKGAKVLQTAGTTGDWSISKNALGVPLYRSRFGWILFKVKGSPLCQLRTFALGEDYAGGGRYKKAKHVTFAKLRWQKCS